MSPLFTGIPAVETQIDALIAAGREHEALLTMMVGVHNHYKTPGIEQTCLYYPALDRQVLQLAQRLAEAHPDPQGERPLTDNTLVIATELGQVGGHTRVLLDLLHDVPSPVLVLTEAFAGYRAGVNDNGWLHEACAGLASVIVLPPQLDLWRRAQALLRLTRQFAPRNIFYFNHHQDALPLVGSFGHAGSRKIFFHHADHNPSLGVTLPGMVHLDCTEEAAAGCAHALGTPTTVLPSYVPDTGCKAFDAASQQSFSVVTSGAAVKFSRDGEFALQAIAHTVLQATHGSFFHIGPLDPAWRGDIHAHLQQVGIDPSRFVALGPVPSLWQALAQLDAHVYLGSAPVGGGRAAVEAQGCGYPLLYYRATDRSALMAVDSVYADLSLGWSTLPELADLLRTIAPRHATLSKAARALYDARFSRHHFRAVVTSVMAD